MHEKYSQRLVSLFNFKIHSQNLIISIRAARHASRKCCLEIRAQEQVVSGQSVRSNAIVNAISVDL